MHFNPNFGSGSWSWHLNSAPPHGQYRLRISFPDGGQARGFVMWIDVATGVPLRNPTWLGQPNEIGSRLVPVDLKYPDDFWGLTAVKLDSPQQGGVVVTDAQVWAGSIPLATGGGPDVPPALVNTYIGSLQPGAYALRIVHPHYQLAPNTLPVVVNASAMLVPAHLVPVQEPLPAQLEIHGLSFVKVGDSIQFRTNLPPSLELQVIWSSSDAGVLQPQHNTNPNSNQFRAMAGGVVTITANYGGGARIATTRVVVRLDAQEPFHRPLDPSQVVVDPVLGVPVVRDELLVVFRTDVPEPDRLALTATLGLTCVGINPELNMYQLTFNPAAANVHELVARLDSDPRVVVAIANVLANSLGKLSVYPRVPTEVTTSSEQYRFWNLKKIEAFAAFGLLEHLNQLTPPRTPQGVAFVDTGLFVASAAPFDFDQDFASRVDLPNCGSFGSWWFPTCYDADDPNKLKRALAAPEGTKGVRHGNAVVGPAAAGWDTPAYSPVGMDPTIKVVMLKHNGTLNTVAAATLFASKLGSPISRVVNVSVGIQFMTSTAAADANDHNRVIEEAFRKCIQQDKLLIIAAGNSNQPIATIGISSIKARFSAAQDFPLQKNILVVGGTMISTADPEGPERRWHEGAIEGTNFYPVGKEGSVDIAAPAYHVWVSNGPFPEYLAANGTSFAAPQVAGVAAALFSVLPPSIPASFVKDILLQTADPVSYVVGAPSNPPPRLRSESSAGIGEGRLNFWQALLYAVNALTAIPRYVGLRVTCDVAGLRLKLEHPGPPPSAEEIASSSILNRPTGTEATRVTLTNVRCTFPADLIGEKLQSNGSWRVVYRQKLLLNAARIKALTPRYVITCRMFTSGVVHLSANQQGGPLSRVRLTIENRGSPPTDIEMLDPQSRNSKDKSIQPWMKLANGDSFALTSNILGQNPRIQFLDALQHPFPQSQHDLDGNPYVIVPFGRDSEFYLDAEFSTPGAEADVLVKVVSLNNQAVHDEVTVRVRDVGQGMFRFRENPAPVIYPTLWKSFGELSVRYLGTKPIHLDTLSRMEPDSWWCSIDHNFAGSFSPGQEKPLRVFIHPPNGATAAVQAECLVTMNAHEPGVIYDHKFVARVANVDLPIAPANFLVSNVQVLPGNDRAVFADQMVTISNRSPFSVLLGRKFFKHLGPGPDYFPPNGFEPIDFLQVPWDATDRYIFQPGETIQTIARVYFSRDFINPPSHPPLVARRRIQMMIVNPYEPVLPGYPGNPDDGYLSNILDFQVTLRL